MKRLNCPIAEDWIIARLDGCLDNESEQLLQDHLRACAACRTFQEETAALLSAVAADVPADPGEDFWKWYDSSLDARLREKAQEGPILGWWRTALIAVTASLVIIAVGLGAIQHYQQFPQDQLARSTVLIEELGQLYGPVSDDGLNSYPSWDKAVAGFAGGFPEYGHDSLWFDPEDDYQIL
jgi:predicted anti-sigma-YlaC factor YlaD